MKKPFVSPEAEWILFDLQDILTASDDNDPTIEKDEGENDGAWV